MSELSVQNTVFIDNGLNQALYRTNTAVEEYSANDSERKFIYYSDKNADLELRIKEIREQKINQILNDISIVIQHDEYVDGEISESERYMLDAYNNNQVEYVLEALMQIYYSNLQRPSILEGVLVMISSIPFEAVEPKGPIMAMGLLSNKELIIRDRAIQCFERWNSKKGLNVLKSLDCQPKWLQNYVEKVIMYIERDGME